MTGAADGARAAIVVLQQGGRRVDLGAIDRPERCDLGLVDDLLRLQVAAARFGWRLRVTEVRADLRELFDLVGLAEHLDDGATPR
jgi:hypothetical protein